MDSFSNSLKSPYRVCYSCGTRYYSYPAKYILLCPLCYQKREARALTFGMTPWQIDKK